MEQRLVVMDGQGGGVGRALIERLRAGGYEGFVLAVGTNAAATAAMVKAGASAGATGEYAVVYNAARADVILGPIGILMANGIMGEVSPKMSVAISGSEAAKCMKPALAVTAIKLFILPAIFLPIAALLGFTGSAMIAILILVGSPTTVSCYVMAKNMGHRGVLTSNVVMLATVLSSVSLTLWIFLLRLFGLL